MLLCRRGWESSHSCSRAALVWTYCTVPTKSTPPTWMSTRFSSLTLKSRVLLITDRKATLHLLWFIKTINRQWNMEGGVMSTFYRHCELLWSFMMSTQDYSRIHTTACHTYTLINWYNFPLLWVKGRDGWTSVRSSLSGFFFPSPPSLVLKSSPWSVQFLYACLKSRDRQRSCCYRSSLDFRGMSPFHWDARSSPPENKPYWWEGDRQTDTE